MVFKELQLQAPSIVGLESCADGLIQKSSSVPEEFENEINRKNALRPNLTDGRWTKILMHARLVVR